jgi:hypothetical protein
LESFPIAILPIIDEAIESLGPDATDQERQLERTRLELIVFSKLDVAKAYFVSHFLTTNENQPPRISDNNFGHLHLMFEAFALTDPENLGKQFSKFHYNMELLIQYIREKLQLLVNMDRIDHNLFIGLMGNIGPYAVIARHYSYGEENVKYHQKYILYMEFWREQRFRLSHWFELVKIALLHHPNSCGSERLFSLLKYIMESEHEECLDDYICAAVYSAYNTRSDCDRLRGEA